MLHCEVLITSNTVNSSCFMRFCTIIFTHTVEIFFPQKAFKWTVSSQDELKVMISGYSNCLELHWTPFNGVTPLPYEIGDWWPQMATTFTAANLSLELKPELLPMFERVSLESKRAEGWVGRQVGSLVEVPLSDQQGKSCVRYPIHNPAEVTCLQSRRCGLYAGFCPGDQKYFIDIKIFTSRTPDTNISLW